MASLSSPRAAGALRVLLLLSACTYLACEAAPSTSTTTAAAAASTTEAPQTSTRRTKPLWNQTQTDRLKHDLLLGYDKFARPHSHELRTDVDLLVVLKHVSVDEFAGVMSLDAWVKMFWTDPKLTWKPDQYGNLSTLYLPDHEIWQPDIMLYNSATSPGMTASHYETSHLVVSSDGGVIWVPMTRLEVYCDLDLSHWPFDTHTCEFRMGSWVYDKANLDIVVHNETFTHDPHIETEPWMVLSTEFERKETKYDCCPEMYVDVSFKLTASRRGAAYHTVITAPLSASIMLILISFCIPYHRLEKLLLHGINMLMLTIALLYLTHLVPVLVDKTPIIVELYGITLILVACAAGGAGVLVNITNQMRFWPVPYIVHKFVNSVVVKVFLLGNVPDEVQPPSRTTSGGDQDQVAILPLPHGSTAEGMHMENDMAYAANRRDWALLAMFIERVCMLFWFLLFLVVTWAYA
ncbi:neuronal acetylcholine receptor subunit alpha-2-like [Frankliniella occidentalis]|uniref:Neuronal acetylcholine receptor subunit alpha-2-like n=1 Tax=Frankliniella occidentalis TaxID=133901 RepID=A0A9C6U6F3_FRAOC|nr:neuronal acetylcholine receptor subunit alpha-2-like [Frankliniella occidentalis]